MERPGPALIGSVLVHAAVIGAVVFATMFVPAPPPSRPFADAVPVSIISEDIVLAGPADAPTEAPAIDTAAAPPAEAPEPPPPTPTPIPTPRPPERAVTPRPTPRPTPPRPPANPPPAKKRETPPREPTLDLQALASDRPNRSPNRTPAPPSGQRGPGTAGQTTGPVQWQAIFNQVYRNWSPPCDTPGAEDLRIQMDVTLTADGRIERPPTILGQQADPVWRAVKDGAVRALYASAPFDVPRGFEGGTARTTFLTNRLCGG